MQPDVTLDQNPTEMCTHDLVELLVQDFSCIVLADSKGLRIFSVDTKQACYQIDVGGVRAAEMLYSTSLLAFVGAGAITSPHCLQTRRVIL